MKALTLALLMVLVHKLCTGLSAWKAYTSSEPFKLHLDGAE